MYEDEEESPTERPADPSQKAKEKSDELRIHAELAAVFEGCRKFDAELQPGMSADVARDVQRTIAKLEKSRYPDKPLITADSYAEAHRLLDFPLSTNDYHVYRRPGEVMLFRRLAGEQVATFYDRMTAHFNAAVNAVREDERNNLGWKQDEKATAYLNALDAININMPERYLRGPIREHKLCVLSTQTADELNIDYLGNHLMGVAPADLVGQASAPPDEPTERDLAWFFKLFSLRGITGGEEKMCFFAYLQKSDDAGW